MQTKAPLRQNFRKLRQAIAPHARTARSEALMAQVLAHPKVVAAPTVLAYFAVGSEVSTHFLLEACWRQRKVVALPVVLDNGEMEVRLVGSAGDLSADKHGVPAPKAQICALWQPAPNDVVLVPGLAFTQDGLRLGQGGGYYDRFLAKHPVLWRIGVAFAEQMTVDLPTQAHDMCMHTVMVG